MTSFRKCTLLKFLLVGLVVLGLCAWRLYYVYNDAYSSYYADMVELSDSGGVSFIPSENYLDQDGNLVNEKVLLSLKPGTSYKGSLLLKNHDSQPADFILKAYDFVSSSDEDAKYDLFTPSDAEIKLKPFEHKMIEYVIDVPFDVEEGDYTGTVVINDNTENTQKNNSPLAIKIGKGIKILLNVSSEPVDYQPVSKWPDLKELSMQKVYSESKKLLFGILLVLSVFFMYTAFKSKW